jgi:autotransporter passenger strand-loop-strand repeat protein
MAETIASGTTVSNIYLGTQEILDVYGVANTVVVGFLSEVNVYSGGQVNGVDLKQKNCIEYVYAGASNNFGTFSNGDIIINGGVDSGSVLNGSAVEVLENGAIQYNLLEASPTATSFGGGENIYADSEAFNTTIKDCFNQNVKSGGSSIYTTVDSGGALGGNPGSTIQSALINFEGILDANGLAQDVTLNGGIGIVDDGGLSTNMLVNSGGTLTVGSLGSAAFTTVMSHGLELLSGGSATGTQLEGGFEGVESGGVDQAATISSGSRLGVDSGGTANATAIKSGGYEGVLSGGTASSIGISSGGTLEVHSGGIILGTVDLPGTLIIDGLSDNFTVSFGSTGELTLGYIYFHPGGTAQIANNTLTVTDNGTVFTQALNGNYSDYTPVIEDVSLYGVDVVGITLALDAAPVGSGTTERNLTVAAQTTLTVFGTIINTTVDPLARVYIQSGGVSSDTTLSGANSELFVYEGGTAHATSLIDGQEYVDGGVDYNAIGTGGAAEITVENGGISYSPTISETGSGGVVQALSKGTVFNAVADKSGQLYADAGTINGALVASTAELFVNSGGLVTKATIENGGSALEYSGTFESSTILSGGHLTIQGFSQNNNIYGTETISSGGIAKSTAINSGGTQTILAHGSATGTAIHTGTQTISSGGESLNATIYSGGKVVVSTGGLLFNSLISSGGEATILSGGTISATTIAGGTLDLAGGNDVGHINFTHTGGKLIAADAVPASIISGFVVGDEIILGSVAYKSGATVTVKSAGVVTITDNAHIYHLNIAGATVGETDFRFSSGSILTKVATPAMEFLRPTSSAATPATEPVMVSAGGTVFNDYGMSAVIQGGFMAHEGWRPMLYGLPMSLSLHPQ